MKFHVTAEAYFHGGQMHHDRQTGVTAAINKVDNPELAPSHYQTDSTLAFS